MFYNTQVKVYQGVILGIPGGIHSMRMLRMTEPHGRDVNFKIYATTMTTCHDHDHDVLFDAILSRPGALLTLCY
jgi:hypothetical protein